MLLGPEKSPLNKPEGRHCEHRHRGAADAFGAEPVGAIESLDQRPGQQKNRDLPKLHADIERCEGEHQILFGQAKLSQDPSEAKAMNQAKAEGEQPAHPDGEGFFSGLEGFGKAEVFNCHPADGQGDDALDDALRESQQLQRRKRKGNAVGERKGGGHENETTEAASHQQQGEEEEHVVEAKENVLDPQDEEADDLVEGAAGTNLKAGVAVRAGEDGFVGVLASADLHKGHMIAAHRVEEARVEVKTLGGARAPIAAVDDRNRILADFHPPWSALADALAGGDAKGVDKPAGEDAQSFFFRLRAACGELEQRLCLFLGDLQVGFNLLPIDL